MPATDFFSNGFVLVVLLFLVLATRGIALHGNYHLVIQASVHVQSALQVSSTNPVIIIKNKLIAITSLKALPTLLPRVTGPFD